jgi:hypothetical protein
MESQLLRVFVLYVEQRCSESVSKNTKSNLPYPSSLSLILIEKSYPDTIGILAYSSNLHSMYFDLKCNNILRRMS